MVGKLPAIQVRVCGSWLKLVLLLCLCVEAGSLFLTLLLVLARIALQPLRLSPTPLRTTRCLWSLCRGLSFACVLSFLSLQFAVVFQLSTKVCQRRVGTASEFQACVVPENVVAWKRPHLFHPQHGECVASRRQHSLCKHRPSPSRF